MEYKNKSLRKKVRQAATRKLSIEEIQHLRRCGVSVNNKTKAINKRRRPLRRFAAWWETTIIEKWLEDIAFLLKNSALLDIVNLVAGVTIIISLITFLTNERQRRNAEVYQAWQVITSAYDQPGSGGRKEALEFLNSEQRRIPWFWLKWKRQSLSGLAAPKAFLSKIKLLQAILSETNLQEANLREANLQGADLGGANLQEADLRDANLQEAALGYANLQEADLRDANLQEAHLQEAYLGRNHNLTDTQIKSSCFWEKAIYEVSWDAIELKWIIDREANQKYIEKLKQDKSSNPKAKPDCSKWWKKN